MMHGHHHHHQQAQHPSAAIAARGTAPHAATPASPPMVSLLRRDDTPPGLRARQRSAGHAMPQASSLTNQPQPLSAVARAVSAGPTVPVHPPPPPGMAPGDSAQPMGNAAVFPPSLASNPPLPVGMAQQATPDSRASSHSSGAGVGAALPANLSSSVSSNVGSNASSNHSMHSLDDDDLNPTAARTTAQPSYPAVPSAVGRHTSGSPNVGLGGFGSFGSIGSNLGTDSGGFGGMGLSFAPFGSTLPRGDGTVSPHRGGAVTGTSSVGAVPTPEVAGDDIDELLAGIQSMGDMPASPDGAPGAASSQRRAAHGLGGGSGGWGGLVAPSSGQTGSLLFPNSGGGTSGGRAGSAIGGQRRTEPSHTPIGGAPIGGNTMGGALGGGGFGGSSAAAHGATGGDGVGAGGGSAALAAPSGDPFSFRGFGGVGSGLALAPGDASGGGGGLPGAGGYFGGVTGSDPAPTRGAVDSLFGPPSAVAGASDSPFPGLGLGSDGRTPPGRVGSGTGTGTGSGLFGANPSPPANEGGSGW